MADDVSITTIAICRKCRWKGDFTDTVLVPKTPAVLLEKKKYGCPKCGHPYLEYKKIDHSRSRVSQIIDEYEYKNFPIDLRFIQHKKRQGKNDEEIKKDWRQMIDDLENV